MLSSEPTSKGTFAALAHGTVARDPYYFTKGGATMGAADYQPAGMNLMTGRKVASGAQTGLLTCLRTVHSPELVETVAVTVVEDGRGCRFGVPVKIFGPEKFAMQFD
jgi:hypothetical protein